MKLNVSGVEKAQEIANKLVGRATRQRSFDVFILAQALNRGIKVFIMEEGFLDIRKRVLQHSLAKGLERQVPKTTYAYTRIRI